MATYYIDGTDGTSGPSGTVQGAPRLDFPSGGGNGDVYRLKRGSVMTATAQVFSWTRQGIIITDYGDPSLPKPVIKCRMPAGTGNHALQFFGDTIVHNVEFRDIDRAAGETTNSLVGQNTLTFGTRGNAASGAAEGVSGVIINCDFYNCTNNAINFAGINAEADAAFASPVGIVLGCDFDGLGGDGIFGPVRDYFEAGWNRFANVGNRIDSSIVGTPVGGRQSAADAINLILAVPTLSWIHDNYMDHSAWDCKHCVMIDAPAAGPGSALAIIERNIMIGYGAAKNGVFAQSVNNVGINTEVNSIIRHNYVRGSRILLNAHPGVAYLDVYSNIFDVLGVDGANAALVFTNDNTEFRNNSVIGSGFINGVAVSKSSGSDGFNAERNLIANFATGFSLTNPVQAKYRKNAFYKVTSPYGGEALNASDIVSSTGTVTPRYFTPTDASLMFKSVDRRVPDFWGRFAPDGIGHIGATVGAW